MSGAKLLGLLSMVAAVLLVSHVQRSAGLAVMSVDLGSEWIKVAIVKPGVPMEIVLNKESRRKTPLSIALREDELLYGDPAMTVGVRYPKTNYFYMRDLITKSLENPLVKLQQERFPYYNLSQDEDRGTVYFNHDDDLKFHPEELLAIALNKSREAAEDFAEQMIKDAVITVPAYFNQAERRAVLYAAELAGLRVLQLMNDNAAIALNYGAFRRNDFNSTPTNIMFYDMGASSTVASIVSYQLVKTKEKGIQETNPQLTIKGVGFDRTLGGLEWEIRLQKHLAGLFNKQGKTPNKVESSDRSMAKLLKEAKRVKKVLSANTDITSQIEGLLDDQDFKAHVTRAELEEMTSDLFDRVGGPVERALRSSEMTLSEIDQVILVGGGTRIPKVQETLLKVTGMKELGKSINADEAAALGAVYHAAHLSKGFKVKKFLIKDANVFPIQVEFERALIDDDGREVTRSVKRTLFGVANPVPQKKVMTFNKHFDDFGFRVNYGDMEKVMTDDDLDAFGARKLSEVSLTGVRSAIDKNTGSENKGIKAHFRLDESGLFHLDRVESVFESTQNVTESDSEEEQSTLAKLGSTISRFFSGGSTDDDDEDAKTETEEEEEQGTEGEAASEQEEKGEESPEAGKTKEQEEGAAEKEEDQEKKTAEETPSEDTQEQEEAEDAGKTEEDAGKAEEDAGKEEEETKQEEGSPENEEKSDAEKEGEEDKKDDTGKDEPSKEEATKDEKPNEEEEEKKETKPRVVTKKENITVEMELLDLNEFSKESKKASRNKLKDLKKKEEARKEKEKALNNLESFIFDTQDKLYNKDYEKCSTDELRETLQSQFSEASDWLYDQEPDVEAKAYKDKLKALKKLMRDLDHRVHEYRERPEMIKSAKNALNASYHFMMAAKNVTGEDLLYTETEFGLLEKAYNDTNNWFTTKLEEQKKMALTEKPVLIISDLQERLVSLEREVRYLVGKAKSPPKPKKKKEKSKSKKKAANATETDAENGENTKNGDSEEPAKEEEEKVVIPPPEEGEEQPEGNAETGEQEGGEEQTGEEPTQATEEGEEEQKPEEPLQLEAPAEETEGETQEDAPSESTETKETTKTTEDETLPTEGAGTEATPLEETVTETEHSHSQDYHKNGDL